MTSCRQTLMSALNLHDELSTVLFNNTIINFNIMDCLITMFTKIAEKSSWNIDYQKVWLPRGKWRFKRHSDLELEIFYWNYLRIGEKHECKMLNLVVFLFKIILVWKNSEISIFSSQTRSNIIFLFFERQTIPQHIPLKTR